MASIQSASVGVWVNSGTRAETKSNNGAAHFLEHLVFKGAGNRNAKQIAEDAENRGIYLNAATSYEKTGFFARCLGEEAEYALEMCADLVLAPSLDEKDIATEKSVILHELKEANDDSEDRANVLNQSASFKYQSLGMPILGDEESILGLNQEKITNFHQYYKNPENIVIGVAGQIEIDRLVDTIMRRFSPLKQSAAPKPKAAYSTAEIETEDRDIEQMQLAISFDGSPEGENFFANRLFCAILGGGMSSRLFQDLREDRGLVYGIDAFEEKFYEINRIGIGAGCNPDKSAEVLKRIKGHIEDLANNGPTENELLRAQKALETSIMISLENPSSRLTSAVYQLLKYSKTFSNSQIANLIKNTIKDDIMKTGMHMLNSNKMALGMVGPNLKLSELSIA